MYGSALDMLVADQLVHAMGSTAKEAHEAELAAMLQATGFSAPTLLRNAMPLQAQVLVARVAAGDRR